MVSRLTGPTHNLLQVDLTDATGEPSIEALPAIGAMPAKPLEANEILRRVIAGVDAANREFGTSYRVGTVRFVADDSRPESIYQDLAFALIKGLASGEAIAERPNSTVETDARKSGARGPL
jgi:hypothetical protein